MIVPKTANILPVQFQFPIAIAGKCLGTSKRDWFKMKNPQNNKTTFHALSVFLTVMNITGSIIIRHNKFIANKCMFFGQVVTRITNPI